MAVMVSFVGTSVALTQGGGGSTRSGKSTQGPPGPPGPLGQTGSPGPGRFRVIDSVGQQVGSLLDQFSVVMSIDGRRATVSVNQQGFAPRDATVYYESLDCTSDPLVVNLSLPMQTWAVAGSLWFPAGPGVETVVQAQQTFSGAEGTPLGVCRPLTLNVPFNDVFFLAPVAVIDLETFGFVPPFEVVP